MIASCYRRMNLFNEALKVYEDIHQENSDNIDCLRGLVQIRKELGMPYQQFSEKLMILDREEEAKRIMQGANQGYGNQYTGDSGYQGYQGQAANQYDLSQAQQFQPQMPSMNEIVQPK